MTDDGRRPLRILHTSDCHLATSGEGPEADAFAWAVDIGVESEVDAVLIVGDLFDHGRVPVSAIEWVAAALDRLTCPVAIAPGNHDVHHERSIQMRLKEVAGDHLAFLDDPGGSTVEFADIGLTVWGRAMESHVPSFRPLENVPPRPDRGWAVIMAHGLVLDHDGDTLRGSPIFPHQLDAVDWDYVALGHVHKHVVVRDDHVPIRYSGATAGWDGSHPGVVLVDLHPRTGAAVRHVPRADG